MAEEKKGKLLDFFGSEIMQKKGLTFQDISRAGDLIYRSAYAFFEREGVGNVETAARAALAMNCSLNDLYKPVGREWPTSGTIGADDSEIIRKTDPDRIIHALRLLELLENAPDYIRFSKATNDAIRRKDNMLARNLQSILDQIPRDNPDVNPGKEGEEDDG